MCGIAGFVFAAPSRTAELGVVERMTGTLLHRGPDGAGYLADGPAALGMRRLAIIDVAGCLADSGGTVWKVEKPGAGDDTRHWGPPWVRDAQGADTGEAAYYASANRGKRSLAIDFTKPAGQQLIRGLAMRADVFIENFRVGTLAKHRL